MVVAAPNDLERSLLVELAPHLDAVANGQSWFDLDVLREGSAIFTALCHAHVALEESLIYPQARRTLSAEELRTMRNDMTRRRRAAQPPQAH